MGFGRDAACRVSAGSGMLMAVGDAASRVSTHRFPRSLESSRFTQVIGHDALFYNPAVRIVFILLMLSSNAIGQLWSVLTSGLDTNLRGISAKYIQIKGRQHLIVWASARTE